MWQQITKNEKTIKYNIAKFTIYLIQENYLVHCGNNYLKQENKLVQFGPELPKTRKLICTVLQQFTNNVKTNWYNMAMIYLKWDNEWIQHGHNLPKIRKWELSSMTWPQLI